MADYRERDVIASRFWNDITAIRRKHDSEEEPVIRFVLFCLYIAWEAIQKFDSSLPHKSWPKVESARLGPLLRSLAFRRSDPNSDLARELNELDTIVRQALGTRLTSERKLSERVQQLIAAAVVKATSSDKSSFPLQHVYDFVYKRALKAAKHAVAPYNLASLLAEVRDSEGLSLADIYTDSGDVFVSLENQEARLSQTAIIAEVGKPASLEAEMHMRLRMNGVPRPVTFPPKPGEQPPHFDVVVADPSRRSRDVQVERGPREWISIPAPTGPELTQMLMGIVHAFSIALVTFTYSELETLTSQNRNEFLGTGRLLAVIDLPHAKSAHASARKTLWIIEGSKQATIRNKVLMVNARALLGLESSTSPIDALSVAGRLVALQISPEKTFSSSRSTTGSPLNAFFDKYFWSGYRDIPGLCRTVALSEIFQTASPLSASAYIEKGERQRWESGLDDSAITAGLQDTTQRPSRFYVIGNNGDGKSFMLRRIAEQATKEKRRVFAIAQGPVDRFDFQSTRNSYYTYVGTRTSVTGVSATATANMAADLMVSVHQEPQRIGVFRQACEKVGFSPEHFLIPALPGGEMPPADSVVGGILELDSKAASKLRTVAQRRKYILALRRQNQGDSITPFPDLSSGEQQLILLIAKMVRHACEGCLFLIDEPEISLHVSWQRALPKVLQIISERYSCDIVIATHAPVLIANASAPGDRRFIIEDRVVTNLDTSRMKSVESLLFEGFKTHTPNNREVHERCAALVAQAIELVNSNGFEEDALAKITSELDAMVATVRSAQLRSDFEPYARDFLMIERAKAAVFELNDLRGRSGVETSYA